jgi:hypothetical protein
MAFLASCWAQSTVPSEGYRKMSARSRLLELLSPVFVKSPLVIKKGASAPFFMDVVRYYLFSVVDNCHSGL